MAPMRRDDADPLRAVHWAATAYRDDHVAAFAAIQLGAEHHLFATGIGRNAGEQAMFDVLPVETGLHVSHPACLHDARIGYHQDLSRAEVGRTGADTVATAGTEDDFWRDELALEADIR